MTEKLKFREFPYTCRSTEWIADITPDEHVIIRAWRDLEYEFEEDDAIESVTYCAEVWLMRFKFNECVMEHKNDRDMIRLFDWGQDRERTWHDSSNNIIELLFRARKQAEELNYEPYE